MKKGDLFGNANGLSNLANIPNNVFSLNPK